LRVAATAVLLIQQLLAWRWLHANTVATASRCWASSPWCLPLLAALLHAWLLVAWALVLLRLMWRHCM
jgi:hypothetical protein